MKCLISIQIYGEIAPVLCCRALTPSRLGEGLIPPAQGDQRNERVKLSQQGLTLIRQEQTVNALIMKG